jgi:hypothetical protein
MKTSEAVLDPAAANSPPDSLSEALDYIAAGIPVIPVRPPSEPNPEEEKRGKVLRYSGRLVDVPVTREWVEQQFLPGDNMTVILRGLAAIDIDGPEGEQALAQIVPNLPLAPEHTTGRGRRLYFRPRAGLTGKHDVGTKVHVLAGGNMHAIVPPSRHRFGSLYAWAPGRSLLEMTRGGNLEELPELPQVLLERANERRAPSETRLTGVPAGERHHTALRVAGLAARMGHSPDQVRQELYALAETWATEPRMEPNEIDEIVAYCFQQEGDHGADGDRFRLLTLEEITNMPVPQWTVQDYVQEGSFGVWFGKPASAKSFAALDLALTVATGREWHRHRVRQGPAVFIAAENGDTLGLRVQAWLAGHTWQGDAPFRLLRRPVLFAEGKDLDRFRRTLDALPAPPALVVVDTLARCLGNRDENSAADMGAFVAGVDRIRSEYGSAFVIVHHTGHEGARERGSSALQGAAQLRYHLSLEGEIACIQCAKANDSPQTPDMHLRLRQVRLPDGAVSCVLDRTDRPTRELPANDQLALETLRQFPNGAGHNEWKNAAVLAGLAGGSFPGTRKRLVNANLVRQAGDKYHVSDATPGFGRLRQETPNV